MDGWSTSFLLGWLIFRGYVSFRECMPGDSIRDLLISKRWVGHLQSFQKATFSPSQKGHEVRQSCQVSEAHTTMTFLKPMHLPPFYHCALNPYILKTFLRKTDFVVPFYQTSQELGYQFENQTVAMPGSLSHFSFKKTSHVPSGKLTWQWRSTFSNRKYIFKWWMFQPASC